jgi:hypothetical protein
VWFGLIRDELGTSPCGVCRTRIDELLAALDVERFGDPFSPQYSNTA